MKKLLILIVAAALFLHFYPQPEVEDWFEEQKTMVMESFSEATDTKVRLKSDIIYNELKNQFDHFTNEEQTFLQELTVDRKSVKSFFVTFCEGKQRSPNFHRDNQEKVCRKISQYSGLL
jgi:hypothetical protein